MLWQRVVTALVLLPLVLAAIFLLPNDAFALAMLLPVLIAGREWAAMAKLSGYVFPAVLLLVLSAVFLAESRITGSASPLLYAASLFWLGALYLVVRYPAVTAWARQPWLMHGIGLLLLVPAWYAVVQLQAITIDINGSETGGVWSGLLLLAGFLIVWGADVGAYFAGRAFGKHKLAVRVSPGKSVEGAVGGLLLTLLLAMALGFALALSSGQFVQLLLLVLVATLASILGDLFESLVKREAGVKDSGNLLPGHGGMLDRIDSVTCALPVFALGLNLTALV
jgi:phosphatidate cytidylyltransferase